MRSGIKPLLKPGVYTLVIPARNAEWNLADLLQDVLAFCSLPAEIIVIDDASDDSTAEVAQGFNSQQVPVKVIKHVEPVGPYKSIREGIAQARTEAVVVLESDCRIPNVSRSRIQPRLCPDPLGYIVYIVLRNPISVAYPGIVSVESPHVYQERAVTIEKISATGQLDIVMHERNMHIVPLRGWQAFRRQLTNCFTRRAFAVKRDVFLSVQLEPPFDHHLIWNGAFMLELFHSGVEQFCFTSTDIIVAHYMAKPPKPSDDKTWPPRDIDLGEGFTKRYRPIFDALEGNLFARLKLRDIQQRLLRLSPEFMF